MELMNDEIRAMLPKLYSQDKLGMNAIAYVKYFDPCSNWTWYATEFDGEDSFFGLVDGFEKELGYFSLSELQSIKGRFGLGIERDLYYTPKTLRQLKEGNESSDTANTKSEKTDIFDLPKVIILIEPDTPGTSEVNNIHSLKDVIKKDVFSIFKSFKANN